MIAKISLKLGLILLIYILHTSFILALPKPFDLLSLPVIMIIIVTYVFGISSGFLWASILGLLLDHDSSLWVGSTIISFFATILLIKILSDSVFTNRSLYSGGILCITGTIFQVILFHLINYGFFKKNIDYWAFGQDLIWQIVLNLIFAAVIFSILILFYKGLKSYLLIK